MPATTPIPCSSWTTTSPMAMSTVSSAAGPPVRPVSSRRARLPSRSAAATASTPSRRKPRPQGMASDRTLPASAAITSAQLSTARASCPRTAGARRARNRRSRSAPSSTTRSPSAIAALAALAKALSGALPSTKRGGGSPPGGSVTISRPASRACQSASARSLRLTCPSPPSISSASASICARLRSAVRGRTMRASGRWSISAAGSSVSGNSVRRATVTSATSSTVRWSMRS